MYSRPFVSTALCLIVAAGALLIAHSQTKPAPSIAGQVKLDAHRTLGTPHTFRNLTILPVYDSTARSTNAYLTLDEGLRARTVRVHEAPGGGDVNTLYVTNRGKKPLYLMGGEVVLGGQQDRCLAQDQIIAPGKKRVPVTVFCVEHGRWAGRSEFGESAQTVASASIRLGAQDSGFYAYQGVARAQPSASNGRNVPAARRDAVALTWRIPADAAVGASNSSRVSEGQQKVWDQVAAKNAKMGTRSDTGTYRKALNMTGGKAKVSVPAYVRALSGSLGRDPHLVGVVACVNGKVVAVDTFGDPGLFRKLWPKLLRSYAADAVEDAPGAGRKARTVTARQAREFYAAATDGKTRTENRTETSATLRLESKQATTYRLRTSPKSKSAEEGRPVHESVLVK